jgi:hypothetical protein
MGGAGQGNGGKAPFGEVDEAFRTEVARSKVDPRGRIAVTTFRGLPKPGEMTVELRAEIERARQDAQAPLQSDQIPRRYRDGIQAWFDGLGEK